MDNHKKIQVIVDSTTDMAEGFREQLPVVPLTVSFDEEEYLDGTGLSKDEFYRKLEAGKILPKTSQASPAAFEKVFKGIRAKGQEAVVITLASNLSGTYQSACIAAEDYPEIRVIDSKSASIGAGILAQYALICAEQGMTLEALAEELEAKKKRILVLAVLDTLEYLKRGGRLSKTAAFAGGLLNIKPVIMIRDGEILILGKARGSKKANNLLAEKIGENGLDFSLPVLLGFTGTSDEMLQNYIRDSRYLWEGHLEKLDCAQLGSVIGTHAGPGAVAAAFFTE